jgi:predicted enzyme related to lactoylglutathione lyase
MAKTKTIELPIHLDINVPDREAEIERLRGLGAYAVITKTEGLGDFSETFTVMHDPEGNGFCVQGPDPRRPKPYVGNVTFSCAEPRRLAAFWAEALGWNEEEPPEAFLRKLLDAGLDPAEVDSYAAVRHPDGSRPRLLFQRRQKSPTESIPIHMDFLADDREADVARLVGLGATVTETKEGWTVMGDPEGNPFCVS